MSLVLLSIIQIHDRRDVKSLSSCPAGSMYEPCRLRLNAAAISSRWLASHWSPPTRNVRVTNQKCPHYRKHGQEGYAGLAPVCDGYSLDGTAAGVYSGPAAQSGLRSSAVGLMLPFRAMNRKPIELKHARDRYCLIT